MKWNSYWIFHKENYWLTAIFLWSGGGASSLRIVWIRPQGSIISWWGKNATPALNLTSSTQIAPRRKLVQINVGGEVTCSTGLDFQYGKFEGIPKCIISAWSVYTALTCRSCMCGHILFSGIHPGKRCWIATAHYSSVIGIRTICWLCVCEHMCLWA